MVSFLSIERHLCKKLISAVFSSSCINHSEYSLWQGKKGQLSWDKTTFFPSNVQNFFQKKFIRKTEIFFLKLLVFFFKKGSEKTVSIYLSIAMATRCNIEAVQQSTSLDVHISQSWGPNVQEWLIWNRNEIEIGELAFG